MRHTPTDMIGSIYFDLLPDFFNEIGQKQTSREWHDNEQATGALLIGCMLGQSMHRRLNLRCANYKLLLHPGAAIMVISHGAARRYERVASRSERG